jgi:hypothetical protein
VKRERERQGGKRRGEERERGKKKGGEEEREREREEEGKENVVSYILPNFKFKNRNLKEVKRHRKSEEKKLQKKTAMQKEKGRGRQKIQKASLRKNQYLLSWHAHA